MGKNGIFAAMLVSLILTACGGAGGVDYTPPTISASAEPGWTEKSNLLGYDGNYVSAAVVGPNSIKVFSNTKGSVDLSASTLYESGGTFVALSGPAPVGNFGNRFLRTLSVVYSAKTTKCCAVLALTEEGKSYGQSSYYPWFAESGAGCQGWVMKTKIDFINTSANSALSINEDVIGQPVDHSNPRNNLFTFMTDGVSGAKLALKYSADGNNWHTYKDGNSAAELLPVSLLGVNAQFPTEVKTPYGYHMIVAGWSDSAGSATRHVHMFSCDGMRYRMMESNSPTFSGPKGAALSYDASTGEVHALIGGGRHLVFKAQKFTCN